MKTSYKIFLTILIIMGLSFSPVISSMFAKQASAQIPQEIAKPGSSNLPAVQLISLPANPLQVMVIESSQTVKACQMSFARSQNLIQDTGEINLNQPASCFLLTLGRVFVQQQLAVRPLLDSKVNLTVTVPPKQFFAVSGLDRPLSNPLLPALPLAGIALLAPFWQLILKLRHVQKNLFGFLRPAMPGFNAFEVLRC